MSRLRVLTSEAVCRKLEQHGFLAVSEKGNHRILQKRTVDGIVSVPVQQHSWIERVTLLSIIRQSGLSRTLFERPTTVPGELITIGSYSTFYEANLVRWELEAFEINTILADEYTININWLWSNLLGGVKVQVHESQVEAARDLIHAESSSEQDEQDEWKTSVPACPKCDSANTRHFLDKRGSILTWIVLGFPILPVTAKRACVNCGHKWNF